MNAWDNENAPEWQDLNKRTESFLHRMIRRDDIRVVVKPDTRTTLEKSQRVRPSGVFALNRKTLFLNAQELLPVGMENIHLVDVNSGLSQKRYPAFMGVFLHETAHVLHSEKVPQHRNPMVTKWIELMDESRIEKLMADEYPRYTKFLTASAFHLFKRDYLNNMNIHIDNATKARYEAIHVAILVLARVDAGIFEASDILNITKECSKVLGADLVILRRIWLRFQGLLNNDVSMMLTLGEEVQKLFINQDDSDDVDNEETDFENDEDGSESSNSQDSLDQDDSEKFEETEDKDPESQDENESDDVSQDINGDDDSENSDDSEDSDGSGDSEGSEDSDDESDNDPLSSSANSDSEGDSEDTESGEGSESGESIDRGDTTGNESNDSESGDENGDAGDGQNGNSALGAQPDPNDDSYPDFPNDTPSFGGNKSDLVEQAIDTISELSNALNNDIAKSQSGDQKIELPTFDPKADDAKHRKSIKDERKNIHQMGKTAGWDNSIPVVTEKEPSYQDISRMKMLSVAIQKAQFRDVHRTLVDSTLPPGRFNMNQAMKRSAQVSMKQQITATPWKQPKRIEIPNPPIRLAVATDVSFSQDAWQEEISSFTWAFSTAVSRLDGIAGAVAWNTKVYELIMPNKKYRKIPVSDACGGSTGLPDAITAVNDLMNLSFSEGVRLLVIITDGALANSYNSEDYTIIQQRINELIQRGVKVLWILTDPKGWQPQRATVASLSAPSDFGKIVGAKTIELLSQD